MLKILLLPFSWIYGLVVRFRNHLYNIGYTRSFSFDVPVVVVGNLAVGGTGKTPMVEYLLRLTQEKYKPAILSRGYKRKTKGFLLADTSSTASTIGDEPYQYATKFEVPVAVGEDRVEAIPKILFEAPDTNLVIMDDGYQHRAVTPFIALVLTDYHRPFYEDTLLPAGRLREHQGEVKRSHAVVVTKCDSEITVQEQQRITSSIRTFRNDLPVFFSTLEYDPPVSLTKLDVQLEEKVVLLTGLANTDAFERYARSKWNVVEHSKFPDHHAFTQGELEAVVASAEKEGCSIVTTEKDAARIRSMDMEALFQRVGVFFVPVRARMLKNGSEFDPWFLKHLDSFDS